MEFLSTPDLNSSSRAWSALPTPSSAVHNNHSLHHQHINLSNTGNTPFASVKLDALTPLIPTPAPAPLTTGRPSASKQQQQQQQQYATTNNLNSKQCNSSHNINTNKSLTNKHPQQQQNASPCVQLMNTTPVGCTSPSPTTVPPLDRAGIKTSFQSLFSPNPNGSMTSPALPLNHFPSSSPPLPLHPHYTSKPLLTSVTPAIHQTPHGGSQPIGLTPFLQGVATPSLVAPNTTFFASDGSRMNPLSRPVRQNEVVLNSPFLQAAAKEAVRREFLNMPTYVTPQDHHGSPSNNQNQNQNDHSQNVSPHSTTSNHNEKEQQHRQKMSEEDDVSEGERTVPKSNVQNNSASPVNSNCHQSSLKTVSENQAENTKTVESISNETDNSSQGDAKVPTSQLPTQQHQPQPQQQQPPQTQQQPATAPPFHTYFMPQPQQPHGMVVMGPHGPMLVHPHAAPHPHAALYGHPQGMMMFPGGQHYVHPPHAHVGHPGVMMPHPYAVHPAQYHASHQQQQVAAQHAQQQQQQNMNQEGNNSNEQRMNNSEQLNAQKCEVQLEKQAKERNNASEQHEQQNHQSIAAIATGTQNEERGSPTTVTTNTMSGTSSGAIGQSPEKTNIETCNSNEGLNHNLQNISSIGGAIGLTNISPGNALKRKLEVQQETAAEKKARIEIEKQELIREFKKKTREAALVRFRQKRSERRFGKLIRYDCRKKLADARPRVKGRFVRIKAGELAEDESESAQVVPEMDDS